MTLSRFLHICEHRIQALFRREKLDDQLEQELSFHLEQLVQENIQAGMRPDLARVEARRTLGNFVVIKEECRDQRRVTWIHDFRQDLRYALQMMRKHAVLTAIAAMALAVCIGANTVVLSSWRTLAVGDLPVPDADRVVTIGTFRDLNLPGGNASIPEYVAWKERTRSFESMGTSITLHQDLGADQPGAVPERLVGQAVTQSLFQTLRVQPMLGRLFSEDEARFGTAPARVVVLSHSLWQRRFEGERDILGREIHLDGRSMTVIGVMPASFWYPNKDSEYWVPLGVTRFQLENSARLFLVTARLANGTTLEQAQAEVGNVAAQLAHDFPERYRGFSMRATPLREHWFGWFRKPLLMLEVAVALGLLIACANVSTLLLKRVPVRRPEISRRLLMGAGRGRILRQFLAESLLLSVIGGALALLIAAWGVTSFNYVTPPPGRLPITVIGEMKGIPQFTVLLSAISCLLLGFLPALAAVSSGNSPRQTEGSRSPAGILVAVQVSLALVLLVPSGLLINSFIRLALDDRGFDPRGVLTFQYRIPATDYAAPSGLFRGMPAMDAKPPTLEMQRVYEKLKTLPGADSVAASSAPPVNGILLPTATLHVEGRGIPANAAEREAASATYLLVTENFFSTMKTPLVSGRSFDARDTSSAPWVAVINQALARRFWPGENPIGKRFIVDAASGEREREVVGIVRDVPLQYVRTGPPRPVAYTLYRQQSERYLGGNAGMFGQMTFFVRSSRDPMSLVPAVKEAVAAVDPNRPPARFQTLTSFVGTGMRTRGFYVSTLASFAFMATVLAALGIYNVVTLSVSQRMRQDRIRTALGWRARDIVAAASACALRSVAVGVLLGLAGALALTRWIESQLWGVSATDPATFSVVTLLLVAVSAAAWFIPARKALRVEVGEFR